MNEEEDRRDNEIIVTGSLLALLSQFPESAIDVRIPSHTLTALWITLPFMKTRYRLTVTMDPEEEG